MRTIIGNKKTALRMVVLIVCIIAFSFVMSAAYYNDPNEEMAAEQAEIKDTITGAYTTMSLLGSFASEDGTTANLSEEELDALVEDYNDRVNLYYSKDSTQNSAYQSMNEEYLRCGFRNPVDIYNVINGGVYRCDIHSIKSEDNGNQAIVDANVIKWNTAISSWSENEPESKGTYFLVTPSIGKVHVIVRMVKEGNTWKILGTEEYTPMASGYDKAIRDYVLKKYDVDKTATMKGENGKLLTITDREAETILQEFSRSEDPAVRQSAAALQENLSVYGKHFVTFEEAYAAASALDVPNGNYYALEAALNGEDQKAG